MKRLYAILCISVFLLIPNLVNARPPIERFYCSVFDVVDIVYRGAVHTGTQKLTEPLMIAVAGYIYHVPENQVLVSLLGSGEETEFHLMAFEESSDKQIAYIRSYDGSGRATMDYKGIMLDEAPMLCDFGATLRKK